MKTSAAGERDQRWKAIVELYENNLKTTKGDRRVHQIILVAIEIIANQGYETLQIQQVAKKCKVSRPLVSHYFSEKEQLLLAAVQWIAIQHQKFILASLAKVSSPKLILRAYIVANLSWVIEHCSHAVVWMQYIAFAAFNPRDTIENTRSVEHGTHRITEILLMGEEQKAWKGSNHKEVARSIQLCLTGAVISLATELQPEEKFAETLNLVFKMVENLIGTKLEVK